MNKSRIHVGRHALVGLAALVAVAAAGSGCANNAGEIVVVIQTDLSLPKDIDTIRIEVFNEGVPKFSSDYERLGDTANQPFLLPGSLTLVGSEVPADTIRVVASARRGGKDGQLQIVREVFTTIPQQRTALLNMPLQFLCNDSGKFDSSGDVASNCPLEGQTCIAGTCQSATVDSSTLPDYRASAVYDPGVCIEVKICFNAGTPAVVDSTDCSIDAIEGMNVGLETEGEGICGGFGCFVALSAESPLGWVTRPDGRVQLPVAVCDQLALGEIQKVVTAPVNDICPLKTPNVPTCGEWSAAGPGQTEVSAVVLAGSQDNPESIAVLPGSSSDNGTLFWTSSGTISGQGTVKAVGFNGGVPSPITTSTLAPRDILVTPNGFLVWSVADDAAGLEGRIQRLDLNDPNGTVQDVVTGLSSPEGLTVRNGQVYWTVFGSTGGIFGAALNGATTATPLAPGYYPLRVVADDNYLYWINEGIFGDGDGSVQRYPIAGGPVEDVALGQGTPRGIVLDVGDVGSATAVYWANFEAGTIMRANLGGATPGAAEVVVSGQASPLGITLADGFVYWTNRGDGTVMRASKTITGGTPELVAEGQFNPGTIRVDDTSLYWINGSSSGQQNGALVRFAKPGG